MYPLVLALLGTALIGSNVYAGERHSSSTRLTSAFLSIDFDLRSGTWSCVWRGGAAVRGVVCEAQLADGRVLKSVDYPLHERLRTDQSADPLGRARSLVVRHRKEGVPDLVQTLTVYPDQLWITVGLRVVSAKEIGSNHLSPLIIDRALVSSSELRLDSGQRPQSLFVPFDNDSHVRYNSDQATTSHEVTAIYDNVSRHGFVIGSVMHDVWKTGLEMGGFTARSLGSVRVTAGATGHWTHDSQPHGMVSGSEIASPVIMVGHFTDWRDGLEQYAAANAVRHPPLRWAGSPPVGWNSWYAFGTKVDLARTLKIADYVHERLQTAGLNAAGAPTIGLDSYWDNLSEEQLSELARHLHANGQKAGIYWTPFTFWGDDLDRAVPGTDNRYRFSDIVLKDPHGAPLPKLDSGHPIDPTHPGARQWIDWNLARFVRLGFDLIKLDFINMGALEGVHSDPAITTGIAAYNAGMRRIVEDLSPAKIGHPFFISLSIAPLFPSGYGHSRRISCDVTGSLADTEYLLNSLAYGSFQHSGIRSLEFT